MAGSVFEYWKPSELQEKMSSTARKGHTVNPFDRGNGPGWNMSQIRKSVGLKSDQAERLCLRCQKMFMSFSKGERMCKKCKE